MCSHHEGTERRRGDATAVIVYGPVSGSPSAVAVPLEQSVEWCTMSGNEHIHEYSNSVGV
jgi:hypothetical protein